MAMLAAVGAHPIRLFLVVWAVAAALVWLIAVGAALWRSCRRYTAPAECLCLLGVSAVVCGWFRDFSFWNRPDPILVLVSCAAILAAEADRRAVAWALMTVAFATGF